MPFFKRSFEGELLIDHRASPGIPADQARRMGLDPDKVGEGRIFEAPTLGCVHCGTHVIINPNRQRARPHCFQCNAYICDACDIARQHPDYAHRTVRELQELITSGRFALSGTMSKPTLVLKGDN